MLELNNNDQILDTKQLKKNRPAFQRTIATLLTLCTLYSGSLIGPLKVEAEEINSTAQTTLLPEEPNKVITIPEIYKNKISYLCEKEDEDEITISDLENIKEKFLSIVIHDESSLEWLNYVKGLECLYIILDTNNTNVFKTINRIQGLKEIYISTYEDATFSKENFQFLIESKDLTNLTIDGFAIEPNFLEMLTHIDRLSLMCDENYEIDFKKLTHLKELDFSLCEPYDIAIDFTKEEYDFLINNGVKITFNSQEELNTYLEINKKLDEVVRTLDLNETSTDQEKLDAILIHVLDNLTYDENIANAIYTETEHKELSISFYQDGTLYGALEKTSSICGNYAAYFQALAKRVHLKSYYLTSVNHAWNLVEIDGEQYYVDPTWLDGNFAYETSTTSQLDEKTGMTSTTTSYKSISSQDAIRTNNTDTLEWYMEDPNNYPYSKTQQESHEVLNLPTFIKINPSMEKEEKTEKSELLEEQNIEETKTITITEEDEFEVKVNDKKWIIPAKSAVGLMFSLGIINGIASIKKNERERRRRRRQQNRMFTSNYNYNPYSTNNDYSSTTNSSKIQRK